MASPSRSQTTLLVEVDFEAGYAPLESIYGLDDLIAKGRSLERMTTMVLKIEIEPVRAEVTKISLVGRLDSNTTPQLDEILNGLFAGDTRNVVYDLEQLDYMSSAGLRAIFRTSKELEKQGGGISVVKPQPQVQKVFDIVKALPLHSIFASWDEVDEYLDEMQAKVIDGED
jgi:anti-anti-sigma factor